MTDAAEGFKGRVLVLGGRGMLGRAVTDATRAAGYQTWASGHEHDIADFDAMRMLDNSIHPHFVVNCAGVIPERGMSHVDAIRTNALGPWVVRSAFISARVIHVSTDCVFNSSTHRMPHKVTHPADAMDLYGRAKAMGEALGNINVRCSFIGFQHGLLAWLLRQPKGGNISGYSNAWWNGGTVLDVADALVAWGFGAEPGIHHLAGAGTTKYALLAELSEVFMHPVVIHPQDEPRIHRILLPTQMLSRDLLRLAASRAVIHAG